MKFQIFFLSLFLAAAHARHEPKGLRGGDDRDLELVGSTVVPNGSSATINCGSGSQCCVTGTFKTRNTTGGATGGGGSCQGSTLSMSNGSLGNCESNPCSISCDGACNVVVKAGSAGDGGDGGYDNDGDYDDEYHNDNDEDNDDGDNDGDNDDEYDGGNDDGYPGNGNGWDQYEGDDKYGSELDTSFMEEE